MKSSELLENDVERQPFAYSRGSKSDSFIKLKPCKMSAISYEGGKNTGI